MSMYWMESLILMSVSLLAQEAPLHPERESLCMDSMSLRPKAALTVIPHCFRLKKI